MDTLVDERKRLKIKKIRSPWPALADLLGGRIPMRTMVRSSRLFGKGRKYWECPKRLAEYNIRRWVDVCCQILMILRLLTSLVQSPGNSVVTYSLWIHAQNLRGQPGS